MFHCRDNCYNNKFKIRIPSKIKSEQKTIDDFFKYQMFRNAFLFIYPQSNCRNVLFMAFAFFKNLWINVNAWLQCIIFLKFTYVVLYPYVCNFVAEKSERSGLERHGSMLHLHIIVKALTFNSHCRKDGWMIMVIPRL